jgi:hypothetical protein
MNTPNPLRRIQDAPYGMRLTALRDTTYSLYGLAVRPYTAFNRPALPR